MTKMEQVRLKALAKRWCREHDRLQRQWKKEWAKSGTELKVWAKCYELAGMAQGLSLAAGSLLTLLRKLEEK